MKIIATPRDRIILIIGMTMMAVGTFLRLAVPAHAEPECMNAYWYSACHDKVTDKWQLCNFGNDGKCQDIPAPWQPSPFDPIR